MELGVCLGCVPCRSHILTRWRNHEPNKTLRKQKRCSFRKTREILYLVEKADPTRPSILPSKQPKPPRSKGSNAQRVTQKKQNGFGVRRELVVVVGSACDQVSCFVSHVWVNNHKSPSNETIPLISQTHTTKRGLLSSLARTTLPKRFLWLVARSHLQVCSLALSLKVCTTNQYGIQEQS